MNGSPARRIALASALLAGGLALAAPMPAFAWWHAAGGGGVGRWHAGGVAVHPYPHYGYHGGYGYHYHPPYGAYHAVPVYPGVYRPHFLGGVAVGAAIGSAAAASSHPTSTTYVTNYNAPPPPPPPTTLAIGTTMWALPAGCQPSVADTVTYYRCGAAWVRPYMVGSQLAYQVIPPP